MVRAAPLRRAVCLSLQWAEEREHERERNGEQQYEEAYRPQGNW
jgi:hypothetical protein